MKPYLLLVIATITQFTFAANCPDPTKGEITASYNAASGKTLVNGTHGDITYSANWYGNYSDVAKFSSLGIMINNAIIDSTTTPGKTYFSLSNISCVYTYKLNKNSTSQINLVPTNLLNHTLNTVYFVNENLSSANYGSYPWYTLSNSNNPNQIIPHLWMCSTGTGCSFDISQKIYNQL